jgi:hypothetical protein
MQRWLGLAVVLVATNLVGSTAAGPESYWPQWRGPDLNGVARGTAPPQWSETRNIKWKTPVPGRGFSTPVLWGDPPLSHDSRTDRTSSRTARIPRDRGGRDLPAQPK